MEKLGFTGGFKEIFLSVHVGENTVWPLSHDCSVTVQEFHQVQKLRCRSLGGGVMVKGAELPPTVRSCQNT